MGRAVPGKDAEAGGVMLKPQHHSVLRRQRVCRPRGLSSINMPPDTRMFVEAEAIDIFTTMANSGATFQQSLAAVFLSGMSAGHNAELRGRPLADGPA